MSEVTCEGVTSEEILDPVVDEKKWMVWSEVPPPVARREDCQGDQAKALTAAVWFRLVQRALTRAASPVTVSLDMNEPEVRPLRGDEEERRARVSRVVREGGYAK